MSVVAPMSNFPTLDQHVYLSKSPAVFNMVPYRLLYLMVRYNDVKASLDSNQFREDLALESEE
jgi:hypothetical protein